MRDVTLTDGTQVVLRPIRPDDESADQRMAIAALGPDGGGAGAGASEHCCSAS